MGFTDLFPSGQIAKLAAKVTSAASSSTPASAGEVITEADTETNEADDISVPFYLPPSPGMIAHSLPQANTSSQQQQQQQQQLTSNHAVTNPSSASDTGDTRSAMQAAFLASADMWLESQKPPTKDLAAAAATDNAIIPSNPSIDAPIQSSDEESPALSSDRKTEVTETPAAEQAVIKASSRDEYVTTTPFLNAGNSSLSRDSWGKSVDRKTRQREMETKTRSQLLQQELKLFLEETQQLLAQTLPPIIIQAICQASYMVTYTHKYFDVSADDMVYYPSVMGSLVDDERSLVLVKHIDRCYASLQDEKMIPAELITTLVLVAARLHSMRPMDITSRDTMSMKLELTDVAFDDYVIVQVDPFPSQQQYSEEEGRMQQEEQTLDQTGRDDAEERDTETRDDAYDVSRTTSSLDGVLEDDEEHNTSPLIADNIAAAASQNSSTENIESSIESATKQSIPMSTEEQEERLIRICNQMRAILDEMKDELAIDVPEHAVRILFEAACTVSETKQFQDTSTDKIFYFPSVHGAIMDHSLTQKANELHLIETGEEEFPLEYTSFLRVIAVRRLEEDDATYGRSLKEKEGQALPLELEDDDDDEDNDSQISDNESIDGLVAAPITIPVQDITGDTEEADDDGSVESTADQLVDENAAVPSETSDETDSSSASITDELVDENAEAPSETAEEIDASPESIADELVGYDTDEASDTSEGAQATNASEQPLVMDITPSSSRDSNTSQEHHTASQEDVNDDDIVGGDNQAEVRETFPEVSPETTLEAILNKPKTAETQQADAPVAVNSSLRKGGPSASSRISKAQHEYFSKQKFISPWVNVQIPSSNASLVTSGTPSKPPVEVYVQDKAFAWLPARVLEYQDDGAIVAVIETDDWEESTMRSEDLFKNSLQCHSSMKWASGEEMMNLMREHRVRNKCSLRKALYAEYTNGDFPQQNSLVGTEGKSDMADLIHLHDAAILYNLKDRHFRSLPYTRVGDTVIGMNPFTWINDLYSSETRDLYANHYIWDHNEEDDSSVTTGLSDKVVSEKIVLDPHVYEVSCLAYRGLATGGQDQTILVTGESGAGKTETVKIVMTHLATVQETRPGGVEAGHVTAQEIVSRVCKSSPVFEAFGNAKTQRNENSSRFGKFTQLQFVLEPEDASINAGRTVPYTDLVGSKCTTYLLEKSRVVHHDAGERSYHIFYQLLAAPSKFRDSLFEGFGSSSVGDFAFLAQSGSMLRDLNDEDVWHTTREALALFKVDGRALDELMRSLLIILQLGNLIFEDSDDNGSHIVSIDALERLSKMTGLATQNLEASLTSRILKTPGNAEDIRVQLPPQAALEARDALSKEIYSRLFDSIVRSINDFMSFDEHTLKRDQTLGYVSLLDIFGFENFATNRFEQFCINYANEKLHNKYVVDNFQQIKAEYEEEGIDLYDFSLVDNADILELLEGKDGLISSLSEECLMPQGTPEHFVSTARNTHEASDRFVLRKLHQKTEFEVIHFASPVEYDAAGFLKRNMDTISDDLASCAATIKNRFIRTEFEALLAGRMEESGDTATSQKKKRARNYVVEKFQSQLHSLMGAMTNSRTRYIRCIKPNNAASPRMTDHNNTLYQLQCSGLITAIQISRESFPSNLTYGSILSRYSMLIEEEDQSKLSNLSQQATVKHVLSSWLLCVAKHNRDGTCTLPFACGKTKVFFKPGAQERLEVLRKHYYGKRASAIQKHIRRQLAVNQYAVARKSVVKLQALARQIIAMRRLQRVQLSVTKIAAFRRCLRDSRHFKLSKIAAVKIQSISRRDVAKSTVHQLRHENAATKLASWIRCMWAIRTTDALRAHRAALQIQCFIRCFLATNLAEDLLYARYEAAAVKIQSHARCLPARIRYGRALYAIDVLQRSTRHMLTMKLLQKRLKALVQVAHMAKKVKSQKDADAATEIECKQKQTKDRQMVQLEKSMEQMQVEMTALREHNGRLEARIEDEGRENLDLFKRTEKAEASAHNARSRVSELQKVNEGLAKKVFEFKSENSQLRRTFKSKTLQMNHKLSVVEEKLQSTTAARDAQVASLKDDLREQHTLASKEAEAVRQEKSLAEVKHKAEMVKMKKDLKELQESHHAYLKQIMEVLEKTQNAREEEAKRINDELKAIRKKKNDQIVTLHKEIVKLKSEQHAPPVSQDKLTLIQETLGKQAEARARRAAQFDDVVQDIYRMTDTAVPEDIGSMLSDSVELLHHLYRVEEDSLAKKDQKAVNLMEAYTEIAAPNDTIVELKEKVKTTESKADKLLKEIAALGACKRCAAIDARLASRSEAVGHRR